MIESLFSFFDKTLNSQKVLSFYKFMTIYLISLFQLFQQKNQLHLKI